MRPPSNDISYSYGAASSSTTTTVAAAKPTPNPYKTFKKAFGGKRAPCEAHFRKKKTLIMDDAELKSHYGKAHSELQIKCPTCQNKFSSRKEVKEYRDQYH